MDAGTTRRLAGAALAIAAALAPPASAAWTPAQDLGASAGLGPSVPAVPPADVAIDRHGDTTVLWTRCDAQSACEEVVADHPAGGAWSAPHAFDGGAGAGTARLAATAAGDTIAAWAGSGGLHTTVRPAGGSWGVTQTIASPPPDPGYVGGGAGRPAVATDARGDAVLAWVAGYGNMTLLGPRGPSLGGYDLLLASRRLPDGSWAPAQTLARGTWDVISGGTGAIGDFGLAMDQDGNALAVWDQINSLFASSAAPGGEWTATDPPAADRQLLAMRADAAGAAVAAWRTADGSVEVARRPSGGAWSAPVSAGAFGLLLPDVALDGRGTLVGVVGAGTVVALSKPIGGTVTPFVTIRDGGGRLSDEAALALAPDGSGVAAWHETVQSRDATGTGAFNSFGITAAVRSSDGTWGPQDFVLGPGPPNTPIAEAPAVAAGDGGRAAALWLGANDHEQATLFDPNPPTLGNVGVPEQAVAGTPVALSAAATDDFAGLVGPPAWDFGDGTAGTGASMTHTWSAPGTYTVVVTATDAAGNAARTERQVVVAAPAPAVAPTASTGAVHAICATRALLRGALDAHGLAATVRFAYGVRSTDRNTPTRAAAATTGRQVVRAPVAGLRPGTRYRVRLVAASAGGTTRGALRSFRTPPARLGPWRTRPRAVAKGYRLVRVHAGGGVRYLARARAC